MYMYVPILSNKCKIGTKSLTNQTRKILTSLIILSRQEFLNESKKLPSFLLLHEIKHKCLVQPVQVILGNALCSPYVNIKLEYKFFDRFR